MNSVTLSLSTEFLHIHTQVHQAFIASETI